jgi:hypothetical protein
MASGKQKKKAIVQKREKKAIAQETQTQAARLAGKVVVNPKLLAPDNSYGIPTFVERGYYEAVEFKCKDCEKQETWTPTQQKWWYEVAKGNVWTTAIRCRPCRRLQRERKDAARDTHLAGLKKAT